MTDDDDILKEKIFELQEDNIDLRKRITYLQEELASVEDKLTEITGLYKDRITMLEKELGDAYHNGEWK